MITALYAALSALIICWLSLNVIKARRKNKVKYGDGGVLQLQIARSAQSNAVEYIPISLLLLFFLEYSGINVWFIHFMGVALVAGRLIHGFSILSENIPGRVLGMRITFLTIIALSLLNLANFIYRWVFL